jgi:hypothetical protein
LREAVELLSGTADLSNLPSFVTAFALYVTAAFIGKVVQRRKKSDQRQITENEGGGHHD